MSDYIVHRGDFIEINSSTVVKVSSFCYITEDMNGLNNKVKSYNAPMFLTASLILPR